MSANPYTVSEMWPLKDGKSFRVAIQHTPTGPKCETVIASPEKLTSLLNDAYQAGVKKAMTDASVYITDLGDLVVSGDSPFNTTNRLAAARRFYESYWEAVES